MNFMSLISESGKGNQKQPFLSAQWQFRVLLLIVTLMNKNMNIAFTEFSNCIITEDIPVKHSDKTINAVS